MITEAQARKLLDSVFEEQALILGGLVALRIVDDRLASRLVQALDATRDHALQRLRRTATASHPACLKAISLKPHPAVRGFLTRLRREAAR